MYRARQHHSTVQNPGPHLQTDKPNNNRRQIHGSIIQQHTTRNYFTPEVLQKNSETYNTGNLKKNYKK